jgi:hypothetical protein
MLPRIGNKVIKIPRQGCAKAHLFASFSQQRPGFNLRAVHVEFIMAEVGPEQASPGQFSIPLTHQPLILLHHPELVQQAHLKMQYQGTQPYSTLMVNPCQYTADIWFLLCH